MGEPVEESGHHFGIPKALGHSPKNEVGGDNDRGVLGVAADEVEQQLAVGLGEGQS